MASSSSSGFKKTNISSVKATPDYLHSGGSRQGKQTKFTDFITSSNHARQEHDRQEELIASLKGEVEELSLKLAQAGDVLEKREKELLKEQDALVKKLHSKDMLFKNLTSDHKTLQGKYQEMKDGFNNNQSAKEEQAHEQIEEIQSLEKAVAKLEKENEEMLESWDKLRLEVEEQKTMLATQEEQIRDLTEKELNIRTQHEDLLRSHETLENDHREISAEKDLALMNLKSTKESLDALRASLME